MQSVEVPKNVVRIVIETTKRPTDKSAYEHWKGFSRKTGTLNLYNVGFYWSGLNIGNGYKARLVFIYRNGHRRVVWRKYS